MANNKYFETCYILLYILCAHSTFASCNPAVQLLNLEEGRVCRKGEGYYQDHVCRRPENCESLAYSIKNKIYPDLCSFIGSKPIICCPPSKFSSIIKHTSTSPSIEKCRQYSELAGKLLQLEPQQTTTNDPDTFHITVVGGRNVESPEFPHMALIGFGKTVEENKWGCGGSLISERWILTAAHCKNNGFKELARWARLGDLNIMSDTDDAQPIDYRIVQHVIHPDYKPPSLYNDIALFRLEKDVEFSAYVRPICLNSDPLFNPEVQIATGWGRISTAGPTSDDLQEVELTVIPSSRCNSSYFSSENKQLEFGILTDSMICAGSVEGDKDTCSGDSGGPLQTINYDFPDILTQTGVTSFGKFCGDKNAPGIYTKVSKYTSWIEKIVW